MLWSFSASVIIAWLMRSIAAFLRSKAARIALLRASLMTRRPMSSMPHSGATEGLHALGAVVVSHERGLVGGGGSPNWDGCQLVKEGAR